MIATKLLAMFAMVPEAAEQPENARERLEDVAGLKSNLLKILPKDAERQPLKPPLLRLAKRDQKVEANRYWRCNLPTGGVSDAIIRKFLRVLACELVETDAEQKIIDRIWGLLDESARNNQWMDHAKDYLDGLWSKRNESCRRHNGESQTVLKAIQNTAIDTLRSIDIDEKDLIKASMRKYLFSKDSPLPVGSRLSGLFEGRADFLAEFLSRLFLRIEGELASFAIPECRVNYDALRCGSVIMLVTKHGDTVCDVDASAWDAMVHAPREPVCPKSNLPIDCTVRNFRASLLIQMIETVSQGAVIEESLLDDEGSSRSELALFGRLRSIAVLLEDIYRCNKLLSKLIARSKLGSVVRHVPYDMVDVILLYLWFVREVFNLWTEIGAAVWNFDRARFENAVERRPYFVAARRVLDFFCIGVPSIILVLIILSACLSECPNACPTLLANSAWTLDQLSPLGYSALCSDWTGIKSWPEVTSSDITAFTIGEFIEKAYCDTQSVQDVWAALGEPVSLPRKMRFCTKEANATFNGDPMSHPYSIAVMELKNAMVSAAISTISEEKRSLLSGPARSWKYEKWPVPQHALEYLKQRHENCQAEALVFAYSRALMDWAWVDNRLSTRYSEEDVVCLEEASFPSGCFQNSIESLLMVKDAALSPEEWRDMVKRLWERLHRGRFFATGSSVELRREALQEVIVPFLLAQLRSSLAYKAHDAWPCFSAK